MLVKKTFYTVLLPKRHLGPYVGGTRMQLPPVVPSEAMPAYRMRKANRPQSRAENLRTFVGNCLTQTRLMSRSSLFLTDDHGSLLAASDAG